MIDRIIARIIGTLIISHWRIIAFAVCSPFALAYDKCAYLIERKRRDKYLIAKGYSDKAWRKRVLDHEWKREYFGPPFD